MYIQQVIEAFFYPPMSQWWFDSDAENWFPILPATVTQRSGKLVSLDFCDIWTYAPLSSLICLMKLPPLPMIIPAVLFGTKIFTWKESNWETCFKNVVICLRKWLGMTQKTDDAQCKTTQECSETCDEDEDGNSQSELASRLRVRYMYQDKCLPDTNAI